MKILLDGNVWFAIGLFCFSANLALDHYAGTGDLWDFVRGVVTGLSIGAFLVAIAMYVSKESEKPA